MKAIIYNSKPAGIYHAIPSKSILHRYIILASLSKGKVIINNYLESEDILATINAFIPFGVKFERSGNALIVDASSINYLDEVTIDANQSASTLRLLAPVLAHFANKVRFIGKDSLLARPMDEYLKLFGKDISVNSDSITINNSIKGNTLYLETSISSQFASGVILASLLKEEPTTIILQGKVNSASYIDLTIDCAKEFGAKINIDENVIYVLPSKLKKAEVNVEGDYTQASNFVVLSKINQLFEITGLNVDSLQADKAIYQLLDQEVVDLDNNIDLGPILFAYAASLNKQTKFTGTNRLTYKESNRLYAMKEELSKFGVDLKIYDDICLINGKKELVTKEELDSHDDHRICMALAILSTIAKDKVIINGIECVNKSYPTFFNDLASLGIKIEIK